MLTVPLLLAALAAGAAGGVHCLGMCGALGQWLAQPRAGGAAPRADRIDTSGAAGMRVIQLVPQAGAAACATGCASSAHHADSRTMALFWLHLGRISTYAIIGALVGASGGLGLLLRPFLPLHGVLLLLGNLALLYLAARLAGWRISLPALPWLARWQQRLAARLPRPANHHPFVNGLAWGCLPCGLLYTVLPFALLSGAAWSGALLLAVFGIGTLPYLLLAQSPRWSARLQRLGWLRGALALLLAGFAGYGLLLWAGLVTAPPGAAVWCVPF